MKCVYAQEIRKISILEIDKPDVTATQVLIRVSFAGVCGSDLHAYRGVHAFRKPPVMLGHELSGVIEKVGSGVTRFKPGDAVTVMPQTGCGTCRSCLSGKVNLCRDKTLPGTPGWQGAFAEYFIAPESVVCALGEVSLKLGALCEPLAVASHVLSRFPREHGSDLAILGAGAIGLMMVILAPYHGFSNVTVTDVVDSNLRMAKTLGAKRAVNAAGEDPVREIKAYYGATGVENLVIAASAKNILAQALESVSCGGNIVYMAMITGEMTLNTYPIVFKEVNIKGSLNYTMRDFDDALAHLLREPEKFEKLITHVMPMSEAAKAFERLDTHSEDAVKILLENRF
ncbi:MAG: alcohol dehydrogenase catalytic domain-containing protein [Clostridia bacterium]|nr:alcohol dehydrogenase catalytic domain-containing protein [Clostridia bacterium]